MRDKEKRKGFLSIAENERNMAEQEQTLALKASSNYNKSQETKSTGTTGSNVRGAVKSTPASTSTTPDFMKTGKKNPKLWENTLLDTVKNGGITKEKPSSVNLPDLGKRSTDSATGEDDFTAWIKDKNKTLSFVKDLPNREERAFGAAIFGKEAEERAYNRSVVEEMQKIGLAPNKTQDQLFREGFYGIEEEPDYTAILKNAIKTSQKETPIQFLERRNREVQNQKLRESQSYGGAKNNFGMESPYLGKKVEPKKQDEKSFLDTASEWLTYASFVPGLDTVTNVVQFPIDLARGDYVGAALDIVGAIPFYGEGADAIKTTRIVGDKVVDAAKAARKADKIVDTGKAVVKNGDEIIDTAHDVAQTAKSFSEYPKNIHVGAQGKHIIGHNNYQPGKSIVTVSNDTIGELVTKYSGKGQWLNSNKERVDFGQTIGKYVDIKTNKAYDTTVATIHYSKNGVHIVPAKPNNWRD